MKRLDVYEKNAEHPHVFLNLRVVLARLPRRIRRSSWLVSGAGGDGGEDFLDVVVESGPDFLTEACTGRHRLKYRRLVEIAQEVRQVIWGKFDAFDDRVDEPWLILSAIDSSFWRVETDDAPTQESVLRNFQNVRVAAP